MSLYFAAFWLLYKDVAIGCFRLYKIAATGFYSNLLLRYLCSAKNLTIKYFHLFFIASLWAASTASERIRYKNLASVAAAASFLVIVYEAFRIVCFEPASMACVETNWLYFVLCICAGLLYISRATEKKPAAAFVIVCVSVSVISSLGSYCNMFYISSLTMPILASPAILLLFDVTKGLKKHLFSSISVGAITFVSLFYAILEKQVIHFCGNGPFMNQTDFTKSKYLQFIRVEKNFAYPIDRIIHELNVIGFDFEYDRIFAYPYLAGIVCASGAKAFGCVWNMAEINITSAKTAPEIVEYKNISHLNAEYLRLSAHKDSCIRNVYIMVGEKSGENIAKKIENMFFERLQVSKELEELKTALLPTTETHKKYICEIYTHNPDSGFKDARPRKLYLIGPYKLRKPHS
ncbi:hypothetical protein [Candidatus Hydrogenosomobacter endosymbioticus]|nr:hypothetical protein [Candidatus Hydrogenosomobacter endosymbioticus]